MHSAGRSAGGPTEKEDRDVHMSDSNEHGRPLGVLVVAA